MGNLYTGRVMFQANKTFADLNEWFKSSKNVMEATTAFQEWNVSADEALLAVSASVGALWIWIAMGHHFRTR